jgi:hypothetical protein
MAIDKRISYDVQGGVKNYLGKQKEVTAPVKWKSSPDHPETELAYTAPVKWKSSPDHPETELAYITKAEKDLLVKKDLHGSLNGGVNRGPSGIMSLNGFGSADPGQNVSGSQMSAAESGNFSGFSGTGGGGGPQLPPGVDRKPSQLAQDIRSAAIAAGAGQRVNPGFFDSRNTVSPAELARARTFNPAAFKATRGGGLMNLITGGGFLGNIIRGLGQRFGLGKTYNQPTYDMSGLSGLPFGGTAAFQNLDIRDIFDRRRTDEEEDNEEGINAINLNDFEGLPISAFIDRTNLNDYPQTQFGDNPNKDIISPVFTGDNNFQDIENFVSDAYTTPTMGQYGLNLMQLNTLKNAGYSNSQIEEAVERGYADELVRDIEGPIGIV